MGFNDLKYARGHGLGNDYLVVEEDDLPFDAAKLTVRICDRHTGVGSDGLLVSSVHDDRITLRIYNPDGSIAEKSGNGLRIFGAYLYGRGVVKQDWFDVDLIKDTVSMRVEGELDGGALMIRAHMGRAEFLGDTSLALADNESIDVVPLSISNPHCVAFVDRLDRNAFLRQAPQLCKHKHFAAGTNVQFARVVDRKTTEAWIWERGVGETQASGSSSCAVAAAAVKNGWMDAGVVTIKMPGGDAEVEVTKDFDLKLRAPAQIICTGAVRSQVVEEWSR